MIANDVVGNKRIWNVGALSNYAYPCGQVHRRSSHWVSEPKRPESTPGVVSGASASACERAMNSHREFIANCSRSSAGRVDHGRSFLGRTNLVGLALRR